MEVRLVVSIDTLVDFYMENKEGEKDLPRFTKTPS